MTTFYLYQDSPFYEKKLTEIKRAAKKEKKTVEIIGTETRSSFEVEYKETRSGRFIAGAAYINEKNTVSREAVKVIIH